QLHAHMILYRLANTLLHHPFPTRRSSDLKRPPGVVAAVAIAARATPGAPVTYGVLPALPADVATMIPTAAALLTEIAEGSFGKPDRKSTRLNSSHVKISYAVFCLKKKMSI